METRYIFNTSGAYVAFLLGDLLFAPDGTWMGIRLEGDQIYDTYGNFLGYLLQDDRVARRQGEPAKRRIRPPRTPRKPRPPMPPLRRLPMTPLLYPWQDVFADRAGWQTRDAIFPANAGFFQPPSPSLDRFLGAHLIAGNGVPLGTVSRDPIDPNSLSNKFGEFGNKFNAHSMLNPFGDYGSPYGVYSPFNEYSATPVRIMKGGHQIGALSANPYATGAFHPNVLLRWLGLI